MSLLPVAPRPVDEDDVSVLRSHAIATAAPARAVRKTTTASCDPAEARLRGGRYLYCAVSVVGFPEGVSGDALTAFLRRFGPVPGPGGVRQVMHAWGLEVLLIFPTQEAATHAIDDIGKLVSLELDNGTGKTRIVGFTAPLKAVITNRPMHHVPAPTSSSAQPSGALAAPYLPTMPVLVPVTPFPTPFFSPQMSYAVPGGQFVLVPAPFHA